VAVPDLSRTAGAIPARCPACAGELVVTRLQCPACGAEVSGAFAAAPGRLVDLPEPHASLLELFIRLRGNVKDVERALGLSYPTVRARLEEAFAAARPKLEPRPPGRLGRRAGAAGAADRTRDGAGRSEAPDGPAAAEGAAAQRSTILDQLERGEISPSAAAAKLRELRGLQRSRDSQSAWSARDSESRRST
jgi:hypothetical protein